MGLGAIVLSFALVLVDLRMSAGLTSEPRWFLTFGPEGARAILAAIVGSMITVAGLTFSVTMLTLQLASSQFGPRLLRSFLRDRGNQVVLGTFISTFIYCLLVLRTVRGTEEASFVPHLSVAAGVLFAVASLAVLIFFIHHTAHSIRLETILANLADETREAVERLYPQEVGQEPPPASVALPDFDREGRLIPAGHGGYVQIVDDEPLLSLASKHDIVLRLDAGPGRFVVADEPVLTAWPRDRVTNEASAALAGAIVVGDERTPRQDLDFSLRRIVEIAQRALSPGLNDPTTACYCIDRLREALMHLARRERPSGLRSDEAGRVRLVAEAAVPGEAARSAFAAVARYGMGDADVVRHLLSAITAVAAVTPPLGRQALEALATDVRAEAAKAAPAFDAADLGKRGA
jgi:uncharacterized membrane protein